MFVEIFEIPNGLRMQVVGRVRICLISNVEQNIVGSNPGFGLSYRIRAAVLSKYVKSQLD